MAEGRRKCCMKWSGIVKWCEKEIKKELEREESKERERKRERERKKEGREMWKENVEKYYFVSTDKVSYMHIYTLWDTWHLSKSSLMKSNASVARTYRYLYYSILHEHSLPNKESDEKIIIITTILMNENHHWCGTMLSHRTTEYWKL